MCDSKDLHVTGTSSIGALVRFIAETRGYGLLTAEAMAENYHMRIDIVESEFNCQSSASGVDVMESLISFSSDDVASEVYDALCLLDSDLRVHSFSPEKDKLTILAGKNAVVYLSRK